MDTFKKTIATAGEIKKAFVTDGIEGIKELTKMLDDRLTYETCEELLGTLIESIDVEPQNIFDKTLLLIRQAYKAGFLQATEIAIESNNETYIELFGHAQS